MDDGSSELSFCVQNGSGTSSSSAATSSSTSSSSAAGGDKKSGADTSGGHGAGADKYTLFTPATQSIVWGLQSRAVQGMLDFDYVCSRQTPSVVAMVYPLV